MQLVIIYDNGEVLYAIDATEIYNPFPEEVEDSDPVGL